MSLRITFCVLMSLWLGAIGLDCFRSLPDPLHCLSRLSFVNEVLNSTDYLKVDEYLDVKASSTSISIFNVREDSTEIHYSKPNALDLTGRRSVLFNPSDLTCKSHQISFWQFSELRRVATNFYKFKDLGEKFVNVPFGPSVLLYAVQTYTKRFKFVKSIISKSLMSNVNVYSLEIKGKLSSSTFRNLLIVLHVSTEGQRRGLEPGDSLEGNLLEGSHLGVKFFGACQLEAKVRRSKRLGANADEADTTMTSQNDRWNEDDFCSSDSGRKLLFKIHYDIIEEYKTGTLIGKELDEFERTRYDFTHEPFLQPVGIGCWSLDVNQGRRSTLIEQSKTGGVLLSASYVTSNGLKGVSYVAFDQIGQLLRLDREGRKSIFDLSSGQSYHVAEQSSSSGLKSALANELATEKCIVLRTLNGSSIDFEGDIMKQLFGLGQDPAHYLGPRTIEHEQFEVYENSFTNFDEAPILLRTKLDGATKSKSDSTYFVTYYVQSNRLLRFIELYSFEAVVRRRKLINRLEFVQFSWSLDVEPEDDPQSEASDSNLRLFQMESCLQNGATQIQAVMTLDSFNGTTHSEGEAKGLRHYRQELTGSIQRTIAESLRVSIMNIVDLRPDLSLFVKKAKVLTTFRVVDLRTGLLTVQSLGSTYVTDDGHLMQYNKLRFSLEECLLDSLEYPKANRIAHCPQLAACIVLAEETDVSTQLIPDRSDLADRHGICHVYKLKYATSDRNSDSLRNAEIYAHYLTNHKFEFQVGPREDEETGRMLPGFNYVASTDLKDFVPMDPVGAQLSARDNLDLLSGLRYTTMREEPLAHNSNIRVALGKQLNEVDKMALFTHCQLSCQLDEFCGSFSICFKSKGLNANDCVLSTLRLTSERVDKILTGASQLKDGETKFQVNVTGEISSQVFNMHRDDACSLHPREFAPDFMRFKSVAMVDHEHSRPEENESEAQDLESVRVREQMSLEDCAGLSFERTFGCETIRQTNFTYCPLDSLCLVSGDEIEDQLKLATGICSSYERNSVRFYNEERSTHMRVVGIRATSSADKTLVSNMIDRKDVDEFAHLVRTFWGVSEGDCARDCSLHKSECLAFDSCRNQGKILCILYSIRSSLSKRGAYLPLLERERKFTGDEVSLIASQICDHFHLKPAYFEVRLKNLLVRQNSNTTSSDESGGEFLPEDVRALEDKIEAYNERQDKEDLLAVSDFKTIISNYDQASGTQPMATTTSSMGDLINGWSLTIGILMGCILTVYKQQITQALFVVYGLVRRDTSPITIG